MNILDVPGQLIKHGFHSMGSPSQKRPPCKGVGLLQSLERLTFPVPQLTLQCPQADHRLHPPSVGVSTMPRKYFCK